MLSCKTATSGLPAIPFAQRRLSQYRTPILTVAISLKHGDVVHGDVPADSIISPHTLQNDLKQMWRIKTLWVNEPHRRMKLILFSVPPNLVVPVRVYVGLRVLPRGTLSVLQPPERRHDGVVVAVARPGPHRQLAQVGTRVVHDGLVHVVPEAEALRPRTARDLSGDEKGAVAGTLHAVARE